MAKKGTGKLTDRTLTRTRIVGGVYEGVLAGVTADASPHLAAFYQAAQVEGLSVAKDGAGPDWLVRFTVPAHLISDGIQTFVLTDTDSGAQLDSFSILAGDALDDDIRAEISLLRAELDLLKKAFRRHCVETT